MDWYSLVLICKYCIVFSVSLGDKYNIISLKKIVVEPLTKYFNLTEKDKHLEVHGKNKYHIDIIQKANDFLKL